MSPASPDSPEAERETLDTLLHRRYDTPTPIGLADGEIPVDPGSNETTTRPTLCRAAGGLATRPRPVNVVLAPARAAGR